jgi:thioredoxin-like negative regulator of GroEL
LHRLLALNSSLGKSSDLDDAIFSQAVDRFLASAPGELGAWLVANRQAQLASQVLSAAAASDPAAFVARTRALLAANDIEDAATLLANPTPGVDLVELEFFTIDLARLKHDEQAELRAWGRALQQAPLDISRNRFIDIARRAELLGRQTPAERGWVAAIRAGFGRLPLYRDLMPLFGSLTKQNRSGDLLELFRILLRFEPQNLELKNNYHYLALIHGIDPPNEAMLRFQQLAAENPDMPSLASSAAMAALMDGQPKEAIKSIQHISTTDRTAMMRAALLGTALLLDGDAQAARPLLANVDWSRFLLQESIIFRQLQADSQTANLPLPELRLPPADDNSLEWQRAIKRSEPANELLPSLPPLRLPEGE